MALRIKHKEIEFGVGDKIKVFQKIKEGEKTRIAFLRVWFYLLVAGG